jgi:ferredoxin
MSYQVRVNKDACISSGKCIGDAKDLFRFDSDELAEVIGGATAEPLERLLKIARRCPGEAIAVFGADGTEIPLH